MLDKDMAVKLSNIFSWIEDVPVAASVADADTLELIMCNKLFSDIFNLVDLGNASVILDGMKKEDGAKSVVALDIGGTAVNLFTTVKTFVIADKTFLLSTHESLVNLINGNSDRCMSTVSEKELNNKNIQLVIIDNNTEYMLGGVYNRKGGFNILEKHMDASHDSGNFTLAYFILEALGEPGADGAEALDNALIVVKSGIRQTDIIAKMDENEYMIIFPKCSKEIVDNIMGTVSKKIEALNEAAPNGRLISIEYAISVYKSDMHKTAGQFIDQLKEELS